MQLADYRALVDTQLTDFFTQKLASYQEYDLPERILTIIAYVQQVCATGKRVRPYLVYTAYKAFGGKQDEEIQRFALGFELFHAFALIHDDVFDQGTTRRGIPTYHKYIETLLESEQATHIAASQAILAGDLVFSRVQEIIYDDYDLEPGFLQQARKNFQRMLNEVILGEMMDVDFMTHDIQATTQQIELKDHLKTASYSLIRPLMTGALLAGANKKQLAYLYELGEHLGIAYQLKDDLEDLTLSSAETDKTIFSDIQEGDQTFFTDYILQTGNSVYIELLQSLWGKKLDEEHIQELRDMFEASGAIAHGKLLISDHLQKAEYILVQAKDMLDEYKYYLQSIVVLLRV